MILINVNTKNNCTVDALKNSLIKMLDEIEKTLKKSGVDSKKCSLKIAYYKDYDSNFKEIYGETKWAKLIKTSVFEYKGFMEALGKG